MGKTVLYACIAALYPLLLTATMVMLLLDNPKRLLLGFLLGAYLMSITLGLVIVFSLEDSGVTETTKDVVAPALDIALGVITLILAHVFSRDRPEKAPGEEGRLARTRRERKEAKAIKGPPLWQRKLNEGGPRTTFVVGALLNLPGASYILGLRSIADQDLSTATTVLVVIGFILMMLILLEAPLIAFTVAPNWTPDAIDRFKAWVSANGRRMGIRVANVVGLLFILRGVGALL